MKRPRLPSLAGTFLLVQFAMAPWCAAAETVSHDWPQFRGPGGLGISSTSKPPLTWSKDQNILWKTEMPGAGASSPVVIGNRIFLTAYSGYGSEGGDLNHLKRHLVCLNRDDGKLVWTRTLDAHLPEQGKIRENHGYASSTPAVDGERIYVFFGKSGVFAFDHSGGQLWQTNVGSGLNGWGSAASPVIYKDLVFINASVESESLVALNKSSGKEVWRVRGIKEAWNTPLLMQVPGGRTELIVPILKRIISLNPDTGERLWECDSGITWYICPSAVAHEGVLYSIGGRSGVAGLAVRAGGEGDVSGSRVLWSLTKGSNVSSPLYHDGHLYFAHDNLGIALCVNARTGAVVYEERLTPSPGQIYSSPVLVDGRIYYLGRNGRTAVVAARPSFAQLASNDLGERGTFNASPAVSDDRLLIRSDRYLYCIGEK
jgi:outer membrane protein assembly factor BamB